MKVCFETFGCRLNRAEALQTEANYLAKGYTRTEKHSDADVIVVRGCSVTKKAQQDCERLIAHLKKKYPMAKLVIEGCIKTKKIEVNRPHESPSEEPLPTRTARAYLKVQDGCNSKCAFCIVPQFRGASVSYDPEKLLDKAKRFIDAGYHEIVLTGCNLAQYAYNGMGFPELVDKMSALDPNCRLRIGSYEPCASAKTLVDVMAEHDNICKFLHLPVQSGADLMLKAMKRPYTRKDVEALVAYAVSKMPLLGLGCDLMTGFPGESEADFLATEGLLRRLPFSNAHIFPFSSRPNTLAAGLTEQLTHHDKKARAIRLQSIAQVHRERFAKRFLNKDVEVLIEDGEKRTGWTGEYFKCEITSHHSLPKAEELRKKLIKVHIMNAHADRLKGIVI